MCIGILHIYSQTKLRNKLVREQRDSWISRTLCCKCSKASYVNCLQTDRQTDTVNNNSTNVSDNQCRRRRLSAPWWSRPHYLPASQRSHNHTITTASTQNKRRCTTNTHARTSSAQVQQHCHPRLANSSAKLFHILNKCTVQLSRMSKTKYRTGCVKCHSYMTSILIRTD